jgi:hypothetical protein
MDSLRVVMALAVRDEDSLLVVREATLARAMNTTYRATLALCAAIILVGLGAVWTLWRVQRLNRLVTVCARSREISYEGEWMSLERYLARRFRIVVTHGIAPAQEELIMADPQIRSPAPRTD